MAVVFGQALTTSGSDIFLFFGVGGAPLSVKKNEGS